MSGSLDRQHQAPQLHMHAGCATGRVRKGWATGRGDRKGRREGREVGARGKALSLHSAQSSRCPCRCLSHHSVRIPRPPPPRHCLSPPLSCSSFAQADLCRHLVPRRRRRWRRQSGRRIGVGREERPPVGDRPRVVLQQLLWRRLRLRRARLRAPGRLGGRRGVDVVQRLHVHLPRARQLRACDAGMAGEEKAER